MRLIDADALVYESIDSSDTLRHESYYGTGILAIRKEDIDVAPTIEPERKRGRKINQHQYPAKWICSECGVKHFNFDDNFCSNCGADVRIRAKC